MNDLHPFVYQRPNQEQVERINAVRKACYALHELLLEVMPNCRERSLSITKLEEVSMWANKGIAFNPKEAET